MRRSRKSPGRLADVAIEIRSPSDDELEAAMRAGSASFGGGRARFRFRDDPGPAGAVRFVDADEAAEVLPPLYDSLRVEIPGMFARSPEWWTQLKLADPEAWRRGAGPKFFAVYEQDG